MRHLTIEAMLAAAGLGAALAFIARVLARGLP